MVPLSNPSSILERERKFPREKRFAKRSFARLSNLPKSKIGTHMLVSLSLLLPVYYNKYDVFFLLFPWPKSPLVSWFS